MHTFFYIKGGCCREKTHCGKQKDADAEFLSSWQRNGDWGVGSFLKLFSEQKDANAGLCCKVHRGPKEASIRGPNCEAHIHLKQGVEPSHKSKYG